MRRNDFGVGVPTDQRGATTVVAKVKPTDAPAEGGRMILEEGKAGKHPQSIDEIGLADQVWSCGWRSGIAFLHTLWPPGFSI